MGSFCSGLRHVREIDQIEKKDFVIKKKFKRDGHYIFRLPVMIISLITNFLDDTNDFFSLYTSCYFFYKVINSENFLGNQNVKFKVPEILNTLKPPPNWEKLKYYVSYFHFVWPFPKAKLSPRENPSDKYRRVGNFKVLVKKKRNFLRVTEQPNFEVEKKALASAMMFLKSLPNLRKVHFEVFSSVNSFSIVPMKLLNEFKNVYEFKYSHENFRNFSRMDKFSFDGFVNLRKLSIMISGENTKSVYRSLVNVANTLEELAIEFPRAFDKFNEPFSFFFLKDLCGLRKLQIKNIGHEVEDFEDFGELELLEELVIVYQCHFKLNIKMFTNLSLLRVLRLNYIGKKYEELVDLSFVIFTPKLKLIEVRGVHFKFVNKTVLNIISRIPQKILCTCAVNLFYDYHFSSELHFDQCNEYYDINKGYHFFCKVCSTCKHCKKKHLCTAKTSRKKQSCVCHFCKKYSCKSCVKVCRTCSLPSWKSRMIQMIDCIESVRNCCKVCFKKKKECWVCKKKRNISCLRKCDNCGKEACMHENTFRYKRGNGRKTPEDIWIGDINEGNYVEEKKKCIAFYPIELVWVCQPCYKSIV